MERTQGDAQGRRANRLARESSPYLLQHAHNPVEWYPWGEEAFAEARRRDVPLLVSIGYSTCYWCHVMERESFEDEGIAAQMNAGFVCVKVDREERPDVDDLYMAATVLLTGHGGWPMTVFVEPRTLKPFWAGTYFPPREIEGMQGRPSLPRVLEGMSQAWREQRDGVMRQAEEVSRGVEEQVASAGARVGLSEEEVTEAITGLLRIFDRSEGGFGRAPKFPQPVFLELLLEARQRAGDDSTADAMDEAVKRTLEKMAAGGIHDHVGGGFHRYSVDATWTVPHFEKMLYDNAQLLAVYAKAARWFGDAHLERVARSTARYMLESMRGSEGAFFSAEDAEVDSREGLNYLWTPGEVREMFDADDAVFVQRVYSIASGPNFRDPHHPHEPPANVLRMPDRPERTAKLLEMDVETLLERQREVNAKLLARRNTRKKPRLDDKRLTAWNGLAIAALARAGQELGDAALVDASAHAADAVWRMMAPGDLAERGVLRRSWRDGVEGPPGVLEDHGAMLLACAALAQAGQAAVKDRALARAAILRRVIDREFRDPASGRLYDTRSGAKDLFVRAGSVHDGAVPSGLSMVVNGLIDLADATGSKETLVEAARLLAAHSGRIAESPVGATGSVRAIFRVLVRDGALRSVLAPGDAPRAQRVGGAGDRAGGGAGEVYQPVEIYAAVDRVTVTKEMPAELTLLVKLDEGYGIVAAEETTPGLRPFRVMVMGGGGVTAYADYPEGERVSDEAYGAGARMYTKGFELKVVLERTGEITGRPLLVVAFQACGHGVCLPPGAAELDIAIDG